MPRRAAAFTLLCLWFLSPAVARAESRAFDFSGARRSARLLEVRSPPLTRGLVGADRIRALASMTVTTRTTEVDIPTYVWLVPLVLTGAGMLAGAAVCSVYNGDGGDEGCGRAVLVGAGLGALLSLGFLAIAACAESEEGCSTPCEDTEEGCVDEDFSRSSRQRAALRDARRKLMSPAQRGLRGLPLGLAPMVGFSNDRASFGLGGHF